MQYQMNEMPDLRATNLSSLPLSDQDAYNAMIGEDLASLDPLEILIQMQEPEPPEHIPTKRVRPRIVDPKHRMAMLRAKTS